MAKPYPHAYGSAMHIHQSVVDLKTGKNVFAGEDDIDTPLFLNHIGGLQKYMPAAMPFLAPYVNSYLRMSAAQSSPVNIHWGRENRTAGLRVPASTRVGRRIENRVAGSDVNPYLAIAASLACGYLGMVGELKASPPLTSSAYLKHTRSLPQHFLAGLDDLERSDALCEILGEEFVSVYIDIKRLEYNEYFAVLSPWEIQNLMFNV
jgi:glutamine synthetase